jgi:hypothetical protein
VLKAYYDGSGTTGQGGMLTLAGIAASEAVWPRFEAAWAEAISPHPGEPRIRAWSTADAFALKKSFDGRCGWTGHLVQRVVRRLWNAIAAFRTERFWAHSCTVILDDYLRVKAAVPKLPAPEAICVDACVGSLLPAEEDFPLGLYFDRGEKFLKRIEPI